MVSRQETARPLLTPGEVMQLPPDDELVLVSGCHPIRAKKARYFEDAEMTGAHPPAADAVADRKLAPAHRSSPLTAGDDDWAGAVVRRAATSDTEDPANAGIRREPELPEHEEIVPEPAKPVQEFEPMDDERGRRGSAPAHHAAHASGPSPARSRSIPPTTCRCDAACAPSTRSACRLISPASSPTMPRASACRRRLVVEAALASHLSPDGADRLEAALARRLDRMTRQMERIERHVTISNEALAVFVRFWLTSTPALPDTALAAAQTKGRERYEGFVEALGRRLARGRKLADEVNPDDVADSSTESERGAIARAGRYAALYSRLNDWYQPDRSVRRQPASQHAPCRRRQAITIQASLETMLLALQLLRSVQRSLEASLGWVSKDFAHLLPKPAYTKDMPT